MSKRFDRLVRIMSRLRGPGGCPWDREQDHDSLKPYLIEEAYEVLEALDEKDDRKLMEELGDLLFQVLFHAQMAKEKKRFNIGQVLHATANKMVRRHPHVFGRAKAKDAREVLARWEQLKSEERRNTHRTSVLDGVPKRLPSLLRSYQLQSRAARVGFDWPELKPVLEKVREELSELEEEIRSRPPGGRKTRRARSRLDHELGDLMFALVNLARTIEVHPEEALREANDRFTTRFHHVEKRAKTMGRTLQGMTLQEMDRLWEEAKRKER
jgi:tetrapyrrole methylase family protein/MazG family protein